MKIILLGCPGAGKGTQAAFIAQQYKLPLISTGDMLRALIEKGSCIGDIAHDLMKKGKLVPDDIIIEIVKKRIAQEDCANGFVLDGFPRTVPQAKALLEAHIDIDCMIEIAVPDEEIVQRLSGRWIHQPSGRVYHEKHNPPKVIGIDDITGDPLTQRFDDKKETILERLKIYHDRTEPLIDFYHKLATEDKTHHMNYVRVDGRGSLEEIQTKIMRILLDVK